MIATCPLSFSFILPNDNTADKKSITLAINAAIFHDQDTANCRSMRQLVPALLSSCYVGLSADSLCAISSASGCLYTGNFHGFLYVGVIRALALLFETNCLACASHDS